MLWGKRIFFGLVALAILQTIYYYPQMPDVVASHWDGLGQANAWSGRTGFFALYLGIVLMLVGVFIYMPGWSVGRSRMGMRIPHPEYWLAPERIEQTRQFFRRQMAIMGVVHLLLAIYVMQLAIEANLETEARLDSGVFWALGLYFSILTAWLIYFFLHFRRP